MTEFTHLRANVDAELATVASSADPPEDDEPERDEYEIRLRSLRDAIETGEGTSPGI